MAKGKSLNPADAYRKAQRKKELKKNKTDRAKTRDLVLVKKNTWDIEDEIKELEEAKNNLPPAKRARLTELKTELEKINEKKMEYVKEHPEHRHIVFRSRRRPGEEVPATIELPKRNLFKKNGLPRHPERSVYYDAVLNPYGVPPPGMPYVERSLRPDEVDSDAEAKGEGDEDIVMPEGPPPGPNDEVIGSDEDIPLPAGPPPTFSLPIPTMPSYPSEVAPLPSGPPPPMLPPFGLAPPFPPQMMGLPPPPPPGVFPHSAFVGGLTLLPQGFAPYAGSHVPPPPPPPPGFFPRSQSSSAMQDPLSSVPYQTFQAHRASKTPRPLHPSLSPKPGSTPLSKPVAPPVLSALNNSAATISAAPQLRDLKAEATAFVPTALKRKRGAGAGATAPGINTAPSLGISETHDEPVPSSAARPDLVATLMNQFKSALETVKEKDDYERLMEELSDIPQS